MFAVSELREVGNLGNRRNGAFRDGVAAGPGITSASLLNGRTVAQ